MKYEVDPDPDPNTPVTIYAHQVIRLRKYHYVGATTRSLNRRWPGPQRRIRIVTLEVTTLADQVERERFWIDLLRKKGHPLLNVRNPEKIRVWKK